EVVGRAAEAIEVLGGDVHAAAPEVLGHVLPMLDQLQAAAHRVGEAQAVRGGRVEDVQHQAPDRVGGELAVGQEVLDGLVRVDLLVLAVGGDQGAQRGGGDVAGADGVRQAPQEGILRFAGLAVVDAVDLRVQPVQERQPIAGRLVPDVVHKPGESVQRREVRALAPGQYAAGHGEVLVRRLGHD